MVQRNNELLENLIDLVKVKNGHDMLENDVVVNIYTFEKKYELVLPLESNEQLDDLNEKIKTNQDLAKDLVNVNRV